MVILAFLQNQWGRTADDAEKAARIQAMPVHIYARWVALGLFAGCQTGRRLYSAFGEEACGRIHWSNATRKAGTVSSARFPADLDHMRATIAHFQPTVILGFGQVACDALRTLKAEGDDWELIEGPHPAWRDASVMTKLRAMAEMIREGADA